MLSKINRNKYSALFLSIYLCFIVVSIIHHHFYDFDQSLKVKKNDECNDSALIDFLGSGQDVCAVNYFSQTISDSHYSSEELESILTDLGINPPVKKISYILKEIINTPSLRAPPEIS
jgi:hypothetical protein